MAPLSLFIAKAAPSYCKQAQKVWLVSLFALAARGARSRRHDTPWQAFPHPRASSCPPVLHCHTELILDRSEGSFQGSVSDMSTRFDGHSSLTGTLNRLLTHAIITTFTLYCQEGIQTGSHLLEHVAHQSVVLSFPLLAAPQAAPASASHHIPVVCAAPDFEAVLETPELLCC